MVENDEIEMTDNNDQKEQNPRLDESTSLILQLKDAPAKPEFASKTLQNFYWFSIVFAAVPSSALACLALAAPRLQSIGARANGILYLTYTASAVMGATYLTKVMGSKRAVILGMALFCSYVLCFLLATIDTNRSAAIAYTGAAIGGVGAGIQWTAQGTYFSQAAETYSLESGQDWALSNSKLAGIFAFLFLTEEMVLDLLSTVLTRYLGLPWSMIFAVYSVIAISATLAMGFVREYPTDTGASTETIVEKLLAAFHLLVNDNKMKYMIGLNASFGFAGAFLNSFVSGEVLPVALGDTGSSYTGLLIAIHGGAAALFSLIFAKLSVKVGKGPILIFGSLCFFSVAFPFLIQPSLDKWGWKLLITIYALEGIGRATFEGTLKAIFADYFPYEKEGAFANIILQNGLSTAIAYIASTSLTCDRVGLYCVEYRDGSKHDVWTFAMIVVVSSIVSIFGYLRASYLHEMGDCEERLIAYRSKSVQVYRSSFSQSRLVDRRTYQSLEKEVPIDDNNLPDVT